MKSLIYLATPYSDPDPAVRQHRFEVVNRAAATMMRAGLHVFSPISHTHPIALAGGLPLDWGYWQGYDRAFLSVCAALVILKLHGWEKSEGVPGEYKIADEFELPRFYVGISECTRSWAERIKEQIFGERTREQLREGAGRIEP